ncbi:MAG: LamG-like jellyroll fold domain-containing protein, partial [Phycisphaeraceae bacterium JB051]
IFNNCASGIKITKYNDYDFTFNGCDFINCGYGIDCIKGNFYVRNSFFHGSTIADIYASGTEHACSVRRCVSKDSAQFINYSSSVSPLTVQDCHVSNWTATQGAIRYSGSWRGTPLTLHNNSFVNPPDSNAPINLLSGQSQKVIICNNIAPSSTTLLSPTPTTTYTIPPGNEDRNMADNGSEISSFIDIDTSVPSVVFDVTTYGATPDDSSDNDAPAIQNAINAAKNHGQGAIAYLPRGDYHVQSTLTIDGGDYVVGGVGLRSHVIWTGTNNGTIINVDSPENIKLENISVGTKSSGSTNSAIDILQTSDATASRMTYDGVWVFGTYAKQAQTKGIVLSGLGSKDIVDIDQLAGNIRINNSARATILGSITYEGSIVIDDNVSAIRDGFTGMITRLTTQCAYPLIIQNNNNFVISDYYTEQGENGPMLSGVAGNPSGRVTISGAKTAYTTEENQFFMDINNYQGDVFYGPNQFYITPNPFQINHTGTRPVNITVLGSSFYQSTLTLNTSNSATLFALCNTSAGTGTPPADSYNAQTLQSVSTAFDDLQKLGDLDLAINYPNLNIGLHFELNEATGTHTYDATSSENIGLLINGTSWTTGINQSALAFNGTTNYAYVPNVIGVPGGDDKQSVSWWQYESASSSNRMSAIQLNMNGQGICMGNHAGYIGVWSIDTKSWLLNATRPTSNTWHHCVYTFDRNTHRLYVDGDLLANSTTSPISYVPTMLRLGAEGGWPNADNFSGKIDDVRIFKRVLSDSEINLIYKKSGI